MRYAIFLCLFLSVSTSLSADELDFSVPRPPKVPILGEASRPAVKTLPPATRATSSPKVLQPTLDASKLVLPSATEISRVEGVDIADDGSQGSLPVISKVKRRSRNVMTKSVETKAASKKQIYEPAFSRNPSKTRRNVPPAPRTIASPSNQGNLGARKSVPPPAPLRSKASPTETNVSPLLELVSPPVGSGLAKPGVGGAPTLAPFDALGPTDVSGDEFIDVLRSIEQEQQNSQHLPSIVGRLKVEPPTVEFLPSQDNEPVRQESEVPQLRVSTIGPNTLVVGKSARYTISLNNLSDFDTTDVQVRCAIPTWVELDESQASTGDVGSETRDIIWNVDHVPASGSQRLVLDLTPRAGKAFELNVDIAVQPSQTKKQISIQEPKLRLDVSGPAETIYGETRLWEIEISNPGTGVARNVVVDVFSGQEKLDSQAVGVVPAGETRKASLELTANVAGVQSIRMVAYGSHDVSTESVTDFTCRRGRVSVELTGPELRYAGSSPVYQASVTNTGDADLSDVLMNLVYPDGVKFENGIADPIDTVGGVSWTVPRLAAGESVSFPVRLKLGVGGMHEIEITATTTDRLTATASTMTEALTAADLKLVVSDPVGPQRLGAVTEYKIEVSNHGSAAAREIEVIAICAPSLEPIDVDGNAAIKAGQIFFKPITELPANHKVSYAVRARATKAGTHAFRVIVKSYQPDLRLATEEQTQFYDRNGTLSKETEEDDPSAEKEMASGPVEVISKRNQSESSY